ncbi:MAG: hypothetical protein H6607_06065 [Flavobacteriales bacterium]|nr:hypothetical protein [Flavobacteriales bacterium]
MLEHQHALMKLFSSVLRKRAGGDKVANISPTLLDYLTRKELIQIIQKKYGNTLPKDLNLLEMENHQLLQVVGDDLYIISYYTQKWTEEITATKTSLTSAQPMEVDVEITEVKTLKADTSSTKEESAKTQVSKAAKGGLK